MRWIVPFLIALAPVAALQAAANDGLSFVLISGKDSVSTVNGSSDDWRRAQALRTDGAGLLYVRQDGVGYVIRDPAFLSRAAAIMQPQQELGARQGALGNQQGELGRRQGALGAEQGRLGAQMANAGARRIGDLGTQMADLGRRQAALGEQQSALGRQQAELGRQQARLAELAKPKVRALVTEAIRRGAAKRVD